MALIECDECSKKISEKAKTCPHCGSPNTARIRKNRQQSDAWIVLVALASPFVSFAYLFYKNWQVTNLCYEYRHDFNPLVQVFASAFSIILQIFEQPFESCDALISSDLVLMSRIFLACIVFATFGYFYAKRQGLEVE